jgi:hypothetical protein
LPLGNDCVERLEIKVEALKDVLEKTREIARSTNF